MYVGTLNTDMASVNLRQKVEAIKRLNTAGDTATKIACDLGAGRTLIQHIKKLKTYGLSAELIRITTSDLLVTSKIMRRLKNL